MASNRQIGNKSLWKCPICNDPMFYILKIHVEKHGMTIDEYVKKYPKSKKFLVKK